MFENPFGKVEYVTSTPKSCLSSQVESKNMEQKEVAYNSYDGVSGGKVTYQSTSVSYGPSSYQAMFGKSHKSGYATSGYATYGKLNRYGYGEGSIQATSVSESFAQLPGILSTRSEEKQELSVLNNRFATYIDKVRRLESQNRALATKITELESTRTVVSRSGDIYDDELARLRREIEKLTHDKAEAEIQLHNCVMELKDCEKRLKAESDARCNAEKLVKSLRKDVDDATLSRIDLERKLETLQEELELLKATTSEDMEMMKSQVTVKHEEVFDAPIPTADLTDSLRDIRIAYEQLSKSNAYDVEKVYKNTIADLQQQIKTSNAALGDSKSALLDTRRQLQSISVEIEGLRSTNSSLEGQVSDLQDRMEKEGEQSQRRIDELEGELQKSRDDMARHLADYNKLMNIKLSLDLEISTYRKLLEGEEVRISKNSSRDASGYDIEKSITGKRRGISSADSDKNHDASSYHEDDIINLMIDGDDVEALEECSQNIASNDAKRDNSSSDSHSEEGDPA
uniref:glial fibrillary acidic protein-like isoform X1 n=1 Tax=Styela clava TaxID=7725 RepID=UPI00193A67E1|nr:glial fibrillary acidic protein-like isoform X1 [Styela clava]